MSSHWRRIASPVAFLCSGVTVKKIPVPGQDRQAGKTRLGDSIPGRGKSDVLSPGM